MDDFSFDLPGGASQARRAFRIKVPGLEVWIEEKGEAFAIEDLSALGMAFFSHDPGAFEPERLLTCDLLLNQKLFIAALSARVKRIMPDAGPDVCSVGCAFEGLDLKQEARLDKLVLEVQKRLIALRKTKERS